MFAIGIARESPTAFAAELLELAIGGRIVGKHHYAALPLQVARRATHSQDWPRTEHSARIDENFG